jgi:hypothetical protein
MIKNYEVFEFEQDRYKKTHVVADNEIVAVDFFENDIESEYGDMRSDSIECGYVYLADYKYKKLNEEEVDEIRILESCGGLWTNSGSKILMERISKGTKLPFVLCENYLEED